MKTLIKNATIVTSTAEYTGNLLIADGKIQAISKDASYDADETIDAEGKWLMPGAIDPHVHLEMPFMGTYSSDDYASGTLAALHGGTTTVIDFILQTQGDTLANALKSWRSRSDDRCYCDYSFHMAVTDFNDNVAEEVKHFIENEGITSFKTFMAYKGALMLDDGQMTALMKVVSKNGGMVTVHATNGDVIDNLIAKHKSEGKLAPLYHYLSQPEVTEAEASSRFCDLAHYADVPAYIVHMTCEGAVEAIRKSYHRNQIVQGETCIQYLILDASLYEKNFEGAKWVMSPPLREKKDQEYLWSAINQGIINVVATDHCPFTWEKKLLGKDDFSKIPNGHPAIEHRVELLYSEGVAKGKISKQKMVEVLATNPAKIFGLAPQKGDIAIGADADLVIFDPNKKHTLSAKTHHMNVDYSCYEGWEVTGKCETVFLRGKKVIDKGEALIEPGFGEYQKRSKVSWKRS